MGYTTDFSGTLKLDKQLSLTDKTFLDKLDTTTGSRYRGLWC